jgi:transglutaminase-like putative cysteine protease
VRALLLFLLAWSPLSQESRLEVFVTCRAPGLFSDFRNDNFRQAVHAAPGGLRLDLRSRTLRLRGLNHRFALDAAALASQPEAVRRACAQAGQGALSLSDYLRGISLFLRNRVAYDEAELPQGAAEVLAQGKGHCIGYANVAQALLSCVGVASRQVNGFFLREARGRIEPVPHRWLEVFLPGGRRIFFDPQYQDFSSRYLVANSGFSPETIERFEGVVVSQSKKILDE